MWSFPVIKDGLIYAIDLRNGLYILRYHGPHEDEVGGDQVPRRQHQLRRLRALRIRGREPSTGERPAVPATCPRARACRSLARSGRAIGPVDAGRVARARRAARRTGDAGPRALAAGAPPAGGKPRRRLRPRGRAQLVLATGRVRIPRGARRAFGNVRVQRHRVYGPRWSAVATRALVRDPRRLRSLLTRALLG